MPPDNADRFKDWSVGEFEIDDEAKAQIDKMDDACAEYEELADQKVEEN